METFSALLAICAGNSPVPDEFPAQRPVTRSFEVFFDLRLNKRLSKQSWAWGFETLSRPLWRQCNVHSTLYIGWYYLFMLINPSKGAPVYWFQLDDAALNVKEWFCSTLYKSRHYMWPIFAVHTSFVPNWIYEAGLSARLPFSRS